MCQIVCKTLTNAQRMAKYLERNGVRTHVKRLPSELREDNGCGYAVSVNEQLLNDALDLLEDIDVRPLRVYRIDESGEYEEIWQ